MELKEFTYTTQGVRTFIDNDETWFVAADVAKILGYKNGSRDIQRHTFEKDRKIIKSTDSVSLNVPSRGLLVINEPGIYGLIFGSKQKEAEPFKDWVYHDLLPTIRKRGFYIDANNNFHDYCPVKLDRAYCYQLMRDIIRAKKMNKHNADDAWRDMYIGFSQQLGYNIHIKAKAEYKTKIEWIADHGLMEEFCKFIQSQERGDSTNCGAK